MSHRVVITGIGAITPVGNTIPEIWNNIKNGYCGIDYIKGFDEWDLPIKVAGQLKNFNPEEFGISRKEAIKNDKFCIYAYATAYQAMLDSGLVSGENIAPERLGVYIGSGIGGMDTFVKESNKLYNEGVKFISPLFIPTIIANIASGNVAIKYNAQGPTLPVVTACATGTHEIGEAYRAIKHGYADAIITGGAEATVHPLAIGGFGNSRALSAAEDPKQASTPFDKRRQGFVIAEGSGMLILEEYEHAKARGARIYAEMTGYGNTTDAYHYTAPRPDGSAAGRAMRLALEESGFDSGKDTLYINAHGTSTPLNDKSETLAIKVAMGEEAARKAIISSTKSMTGHMLGATGAVEAIFAILALRDGIVPPTIGYREPDPECDLDYTPNTARKADLTIAMSNTLGFGGHNSSIAFRKID
ncbi:MAG: beta-ketoacyl-ACP synthase II [Bacteroidales bacterium]|nr:beta-ketoacyl-ACP synthase II [Bacteroidales bacterium]